MSVVASLKYMHEFLIVSNDQISACKLFWCSDVSRLKMNHLSRVDVEHMAIDWLTGNFYFVDRVNDRIFVCSEQGDACVTIIDLDIQNPKGLALDPIMGYDHEDRH